MAVVERVFLLLMGLLLGEYYTIFPPLLLLFFLLILFLMERKPSLLSDTFDRTHISLSLYHHFPFSCQSFLHLLAMAAIMFIRPFASVDKMGLIRLANILK